MTARPPHPPIDELSGRWVIERADPADSITIQNRPATVWALTVRHADTGARDYVRCAALARTTYRAGQEIDGRIERRRDGVWFKRDRPPVRRRGV